MRYVRSESSMSGNGGKPADRRLVPDTSVYSHLLTGHPRVINYVDAPPRQLLNPTSRSPLSAAS